MNLILSILSALFLSFIAAGAEEPAVGTYYIYNRVLSPIGDKLAITYQGENKYAIVTPLKNSTAQQWVIANSNVSPATDKTNQVGWGSEGAIVLPPGGYVWVITKGSLGDYTFEDGGRTAYWSLNYAVNASNVAIASGKGTDSETWILQKTVA